MCFSRSIGSESRLFRMNVIFCISNASLHIWCHKYLLAKLTKHTSIHVHCVLSKCVRKMNSLSTYKMCYLHTYPFWKWRNGIFKIPPIHVMISRTSHTSLSNRQIGRLSQLHTFTMLCSGLCYQTHSTLILTKVVY